MSSPYVILGNRPLDQWKVTELKEELKRRKLTIRGLKEDLIKRLDEAVRTEMENVEGITDISLIEVNQSVVSPEKAMTGSDVSKTVRDSGNLGSGGTQDRGPEIEMNDAGGLLTGSIVVEVDPREEINIIGLEEWKTTQPTDTTTMISETTEIVTCSSGSRLASPGVVTDVDPAGGLGYDGVEPHPENNISEPNLQSHQLYASGTPLIPSSRLSLQQPEIQSEVMNSTGHLENEGDKSAQPGLNVPPLQCQVFGVEHPDLESQVISDSVSTQSFSIIEKNEAKVDVITDNAKLELIVDPESMQPPPISLVVDAGDTRTIETVEPLDIKQSIEVTHSSKAGNFDSHKNLDSDGLGPEKLNLEQSSGDYSPDEDVSESKQMGYKSDSITKMNRVEKIELLPVEEDTIVDVDGMPAASYVAKDDDKVMTTTLSVKRKLNDIETLGNNDTSKRPHRRNVEGLKGSEAQSGAFDIPAFRTSNNSLNDSQVSYGQFNKSDSVIDESPKERLVPPSSRSPSNSLRIDRFLRPFTLKAVQELLGKTGTVTSFWMDHIKTHCYVSYSSVEEAIETRNAVYNLQWPPNGGRMLVAEFVEADEVEVRANAPLASSTTPSGSAAPIFPNAQTTMQNQSSPFLPPPPLASVPPVREHTEMAWEPQLRELLANRDQPILPSPPPLIGKIEPPIVTLDDLFRKTISTPRIYYLPLSDEQVAAKLNAQGTDI